MVEAATRADIPCLDVEHGSPTGVVHLPVAPRCNLRCTYCDPACDCVHSGPPGFRSALLAPGQALRFLDQAIAAEPRVSAVATAGCLGPSSSSRIASARPL